MALEVGAVAEGKTVDRILVGYDNAGGDGGDAFGGWIDDVAIAAGPPARRTART